MAIKKILIANRGEIACRILRTAQALGYATVAVFSDSDAASPHVLMADQAVRLGPAEAKQAYLSADRILAAAKKCGADAIHPGYGFLAENEMFARQVIAAGLTWIGPPPCAMAIMGNKAAAKQAVADKGVPLIPGYAGSDQHEAAFASAAAQIGYPVMVKAAAGGGGRGMRLVNAADALPAALARARSESVQAFGSPDLLLEKAIVNARHIEFQLFGDQQGNLIHLGERDCSIQRRYQKVVEEAPSPALSAELRAKMGETAVNVAKAVNYVGAGTVEFLLDENGDYFFIEMNTRLQVEHPVTELITGLDLVAWQLLVAEGEPLPLAQDQVTLRGHAIEVRLYAESPENDFLPDIGTVWHYQPPSGIGVRVDDGLRSGQLLSPNYDAMVAKIITYGETRALAQRRMQRALGETAVLGVDTNRRLLLNLTNHPDFLAGKVTTAFINTHWQPEPRATSPLLVALAATVMFQTASQLGGHTQPGGWLSWGTTYCVDADNRDNLVSVRATVAGLQIHTGAQTFTIQVLSCQDHQLRYELEKVQDVALFAFGEDGRLWLQAGLETASFVDVLLAEPETADSLANGAITAPMPGSVLRLDVAIGDRVKKGQPLLVLEAMKMEHSIAAPFDGTVSQILVQQGQQMQSNERLIVVKAEGAEA